MNSARQIALTLDRSLTKPTQIIVFGAAAILLDPLLVKATQNRNTGDIDLIIPNDREVEIDADAAFWTSLQAANDALAKDQFYITHLMPERQVVLSADWQRHKVSIPMPEAKFLQIERPRTLDLILSKMGRGDENDLNDIRAIMRVDPVKVGDLRLALASANVPAVYAGVFPGARDRIVELVENIGLGKDRPFGFRMPRAPGIAPER